MNEVEIRRELHENWVLRGLEKGLKGVFRVSLECLQSVLREPETSQNEPQETNLVRENPNRCVFLPIGNTQNTIFTFYKTLKNVGNLQNGSVFLPNGNTNLTIMQIVQRQRFL